VGSARGRPRSHGLAFSAGFTVFAACAHRSARTTKRDPEVHVTVHVPPAATARPPCDGATAAPRTGTQRVKRGMANMLKGGVIMDVVTAGGSGKLRGLVALCPGRSSSGRSPAATVPAPRSRRSASSVMRGQAHGKGMREPARYAPVGSRVQPGHRRRRGRHANEDDAPSSHPTSSALASRLAPASAGRNRSGVKGSPPM
jgi:hypothetical protein